MKNLQTIRFTAIAIALLVLAGCGSGSGAATSATPLTTAPLVSNYNGPPPATPDVQTFKLTLWDNLLPNNRCGSCHNDSQNPRFVRADDINLAYDAANTVVDLADPAMSIMVGKVRGGHNCWLSDDNACGDIIESYIENWAGATFGGVGKAIELIAPPLQAPGDSKNFPALAPPEFTAVYNLLRTYCVNCHSEAAAIPQSPYFASANMNAAYDAAQAKIDLDNPGNSRFVLRLRQESHNCWNQCDDGDQDFMDTDDSGIMQTAIFDLATAIPTTVIDPNLVTSMALGLPDGIVSSAGGRFEANLIALYEFKTGSGNQVFDTSGIEPSLNLTLSGTYNWVGGWGVQFINGKAQGSTTASSKLHDLITSTGEFSIEAWVAPGNVTQDGPARIISYSGGSTARNFMLGQTLYDYDTFTRTDQTDQSGEPQLSTPAMDEVLQASLQHVVLNYDPINGRQIFVNGELIGVVDPVSGGLLNEWDDTFALAIASEVDNNDRWAGTVRLLAIHNRALTPAQINENFQVGVGEKYFMLFNVGAHVGIPDAYIVIEVSQFDSYSYLFDEPFFVVLDAAGVTLGDIPLRGMRIGLNGRELVVGQAFKNLDLSLNDVAYATEGLQRLSALGTVIQLEKGPALDEFFLTFEELGGSTNVVTEPAPVAPPAPPPVPRDEPDGIRDFAEINATMSKMTGIPVDDAGVLNLYNRVRTALPVQTKIAGFISSQQMGVTQLALGYCAALVGDTAERALFWPDFPWGTPVGSAFNDLDAVTDPLIENVLGLNLPTQLDPGELKLEVNALVGRLVGNGASVDSTMIGACSSVLGSAAMLIQ